MRPSRPRRASAPILVACLAAAATGVTPVAAPTAPFGDPGVDGTVRALTVWEGQLIVGGELAEAGGIPVARLARWDGAAWQPLGDGVAGTRTYWDTLGNELIFAPCVDALTVFAGDVVAGGSFTTAGGAPAASVARWDGAVWSPLGEGFDREVLAYGPGGEIYHFPPRVSALAVLDGTLYAGGQFTASGDSATFGIARWDGAAWAPVGRGLLGGTPARTLALEAEAGRLLAGGDFELADLSFVQRVAAWDGAAWSALGAVNVPAGAVRTLALLDGDVIVGGDFTSAGGAAARHVARWDGAAWHPLGDGLARPVHALQVYGGRLHAGAWRWDGGGWTNVVRSDGRILAMTVYHNRLIVGGEFNVLDGRVSRNIGAWPTEITPTYLLAFAAERVPGGARIAWELAFAREGARFLVWRGDGAGGRDLLTADPLPGAATGAFLDPAPPPGPADYWLQEIGPDGRAIAWHGPAGLAAAAGGPPALALHPVTPNPFNPATRIGFTLPRAARVRLAIRDVRGGLIAVLAEGPRAAGTHEELWDGRDAGGTAVASGLYLAVLETPEGIRSRKLSLVR